MTELSEYLKQNKQLSKHTILGYSKAYDKVTDLLDVPLAKAKQKDILDIVKTLSESPNSITQYINAVIQIRRFYQVPVDRLLKERERLQVRIQEVKDQANSEKFDNLPDASELKKWLNKLYSEERWRDFLINYILITFNTRNKDLDLVIVDHKRKAKDKNTNYLIARPSGRLELIRRDYKTFGTYGEKINVFNNRKTIHAMKEFIKEKNNQFPIYLLSTGNNKRIDETSIAKFIRARTLNGLSESDINKIQVSTIDKLGDFRLLKKMSKNRGTSVDNLITEYHLKFKNT
tara:strand:- start:125 stop:991 length:867 start_codon:yes stop_codon:yes gene_type:complete